MAKRISITPEEFQEKQARNLINATPDIRRGVMNVDKCPSHLTDEQLQKMSNNFQEAMTSGKTKRAMHAVSLEDWKRNTVEIGIARIPAGIAKSKAKVIAFATELIAYEQEGLNKINALPKVTFQDSITRMVAWAEHMKNFRRAR